MAIGEDPLVDLRLDVDALDAWRAGQPRHVDLVVEVTDVPDDGLVLHARHVLRGDDVLVAGCRDDDVGQRKDVLRAW